MGKSIPFIGVGLSYRWGLHAGVMRAAGEIDWLEITPEHFMPFHEDAERRLALLAKRFPIVGHSLELSVGSSGPDESGYREAIARMLATSAAVWHGDHLCFTRAGDVPIHALTPLPFTDEAVDVCARNIRSVASEIGATFIVENIAYVVESPLHTMGEAEFIRRVAIEADCGVVLDLHNVFANATNHKRDPYRMLEQLPLDRVVQIHIAGGDEIEGILFDTHASLCPAEVWELLEYVVPRCAVRGVNFEMDSRFPPFDVILSELARARAILRKHGLH